MKNARRILCALLVIASLMSLIAVPASAAGSGMTDVTAYFAGKTISIRSVQNGHYLCVERDEKDAPAKCNRTNASDWETFYVSDLTADGWVGLKAKANGAYLSARADAPIPGVHACCGYIQAWECFRIYLKNNRFFILAQANGKWLSSRIDMGGVPLCAAGEAPSDWERFTIDFEEQLHYISATEIISTAVAYGIGAGSKAYQALCGINTNLGPQVSSADRQKTVIYMFEGAGSSANASKRYNAMAVVVKNGDIVYLNRNCTTIPDRPFEPAKSGLPTATLKSGFYRFTTVNHKGYAALRVVNPQVLRFRNSGSYYDDKASGIDVHRRYHDNLSSSSPNSIGCLLIGNKGTGTSSEYVQFIRAVGIVNSKAKGTSPYNYRVEGVIVVDRRSFGHDYLSQVGYSEDAIRRLG